MQELRDGQVGAGACGVQQPLEGGVEGPRLLADVRVRGGERGRPRVARR
ncbi:hypothetical protein ACGFYY_13405 [Streptomyces sp. NPDC048331]